MGNLKGGFTVIIVEDSVDDIIFIRRQLLDLEWEVDVRTCFDASHFQLLLKTTNPNLIISDYKLPGWSGLEALLISKEKAPDVPFFFVSGAVDEKLSQGTALNKADGFLPKSRISQLSNLIYEYFQKEDEEFLNSEMSKNVSFEEENMMLDLLRDIRDTYEKQGNLKPLMDRISKLLDT